VTLCARSLGRCPGRFAAQEHEVDLDDVLLASRRGQRLVSDRGRVDRVHEDGGGGRRQESLHQRHAAHHLPGHRRQQGRRRLARRVPQLLCLAGRRRSGVHADGLPGHGRQQ